MMKFLLSILLSLNVAQAANVKISQLPLQSAASTSSFDSFPYVDSVDDSTNRIRLGDLPNLPSLQSVFTSLIPSQTGNSGKVLSTNGISTQWAGSTGTVSSVAISEGSSSALYGVSGSPITSSGTIILTLNNQSANKIFAGASTGSSVQPSFRSLVGADLPNPSASSLGGVQSISALTHNFLTTISTSGVPSQARPACGDLSDSTNSCSVDATNASNILSGTLPSGRLPNPSASTLGGVESLSAVTHNFLTSISTSGVPTQAQPDFSDLSGSLSSSQLPSFSGDVVNSSSVMTVVSVGGSSSTAIGTATVLSNNATSSNTANQIVKRDGSGNFSAGTITAALTGSASGNTTYSANNHGIVVSSASNAMTVVAPDASASKVLKSGGSSADPSWLSYDNANTASTLVARDGSGNFSAGTITAALSGNATTATTATSATSATTATNANNGATVSTVTNASFFPLMAASVSNSNQPFNLSAGLTFNPSSNTLSTTTFSGALSGTATNSTNVATTSTTTNGTYFPLFVSSSSNSNQAANLSLGLSFNPSTSTVTATTFVGNLTGNVSGTAATFTGNLTGDVTSSGMATSYSATVPINKGGTGQTTKAAAFDALSPMSASGDIIYGGTSGTGTRLAKGGDTQVLTLASGLPTWANASAGFSNPMTTGGDIIIGGSAGTAIRLANGSVGQVLISSGGSAAETWGYGANLNVTAQTSTYAILTSDNVVLCSGSSFTSTLPTAVGVTGKQYIIKKTDSSLSNVFTVATTSSQTINASTTTKLSTQYEALTVVSDGSNWQVLDRFIPGTPTAYTPSFTNYGTVTSVAIQWQRLQNNIHIFGTFNAGTTAAGTGSLSIPTGLTIDTGVLSVGNTVGNQGPLVGIYGQNGAANRAGYFYTATGTSTSLIYLGGRYASASILIPENVSSIFASATIISIDITVPITGWQP